MSLMVVYPSAKLLKDVHRSRLSSIRRGIADVAFFEIIALGARCQGKARGLWPFRSHRRHRLIYEG